MPPRPTGRLAAGCSGCSETGRWPSAAGWRVTGLLLVVTLGTQLLSQPWLLLALALYVVDLLVAFFVQRPGVARLLRLRRETGEAAVERWRTWARRQRYVSYLMAGLVGMIAVLMMTKPQL